MVCAGFRDAHWDIQDPPSAQADPAADQDPHDEENMEARPDQEEMKEARTSRLGHLFSQLPKPAQGLVRSMSVPTRSRQVKVLLKDQVIYQRQIRNRFRI